MRDLNAIVWPRQLGSRYDQVSPSEAQFVRNRALITAMFAGAGSRFLLDFDQHLGSVAPWLVMPLSFLLTILWGRSYYRTVGVSLPGRVLLVEDDPGTSGLMKRIIEARGWTVDQAFTVREAVQKLAYDPRWVVLDVRLPDGSGLAMVPTIRQHHSPPGLIILTGTTDSSIHAEMIACRPDAIVYKPVDDPTAILNTLGDPFE